MHSPLIARQVPLVSTATIASFRWRLRRLMTAPPGRSCYERPACCRKTCLLGGCAEYVRVLKLPCERDGDPGRTHIPNWILTRHPWRTENRSRPTYSIAALFPGVATLAPNMDELLIRPEPRAVPGCRIPRRLPPTQQLDGAFERLVQLPLRSHKLLDRHSRVRIAACVGRPTASSRGRRGTLVSAELRPSFLLGQTDPTTCRRRHSSSLLVCHRLSPHGSLTRAGMIVANRQTDNGRNWSIRLFQHCELFETFRSCFDRDAVDSCLADDFAGLVICASHARRAELEGRKTSLHF